MQIFLKYFFLLEVNGTVIWEEQIMKEDDLLLISLPVKALGGHIFLGETFTVCVLVLWQTLDVKS